MRNSDILCTQATERDDISKIARYIHLTDPYIYPMLCRDPEDVHWVRFVESCLKSPKNIYSLEHISVIKAAGRIIGVACVVPCGEDLTFTEGIDVPAPLKKHLSTVMDGYFAPLIRESREFTGYNIVNICIDEQYRGMGMGKRLVRHCVERYGDEVIHLDVIEENTAAVRLYESCGFKTQHRYNGFSGTGEALSCLHMVRK